MLAFFMSLSFVSAQVTTPAPSPLSTIEQKVGLTDVSVTYSRPSMKGRKIFGELVAYDNMWRTGANASTKIEFNKEVTIGGTKVPAGEYALYTIPAKDEWTVILHKNTSYWGTGGENYKEEEDAVRFKVKAENTSYKTETFTIGFDNLTRTSADLTLQWENTAVSFKLETGTDAEVEKQIERFAENPQASLANSYFRAASFYLEKGDKLDKALEYAKKATEIRPDAYWMLRTQALIQAAQKDYKGAMATLAKSTAKAKERGNEGYAEMNANTLKEWKSLK